MQNTLFYGDNLSILRDHVDDESVDLIYLDPPFQSNQDYNVLFTEKDGTRAAAQIKAFEDTWTWDQSSAAAYQESVEGGGRVSEVMRAFMTFLGGNDMMAYLSMMAPRLVELRRVLKNKGSIYLHCDPTASHYLKLLMDAVFGPVYFKNEIIWQRTNAHNTAGQYGRIHDVLLFYVKSAEYTWNRVTTDFSPAQLKRYKKDPKDGRLYTGQDLTASRPNSGSGKFEWRGTMPPANRGWGYEVEKLEEWWAEGLILTKEDGTPRMDGLKVYLDEKEGKFLQSVWTDIPRIPNTGSERLGYPTQKPEGLLERIIESSSKEGDVVLDPFCGCGTAIAAAQNLGRKWIGIDITHLAIGLIKHRLFNHYGSSLKYSVVGEPVTLPDAQELAREDPYEFQWWAAGIVGGRLNVDRKKGADKGIDGRLYFHDENDPTKSKQIVLSVKSGHIPKNHIRELRGVLEREDAQIATLLTLEHPTKPMKAEAATAGSYTSPMGTKHARIQILTIEDLLAGKRIDCPNYQLNVTYKRAKKYRAVPSEQPQSLPWGETVEPDAVPASPAKAEREALKAESPTPRYVRRLKNSKRK